MSEKLMKGVTVRVNQVGGDGRPRRTTYDVLVNTGKGRKNADAVAAMLRNIMTGANLPRDLGALLNTALELHAEAAHLGALDSGDAFDVSNKAEAAIADFRSALAHTLGNRIVDAPAGVREMRFDSAKLGYTRTANGLAVHYPRHEAGNVTYGAGFAFDPHPEIIAKPDSERGRLWREMLTPGRDGDRNPKGEDPKGLSAKHESAVPSGNRRESPL
jgi:hypothetical protein